MSSVRAVIVGGGILGTMHALEACSRGWSVTHLEADASPRRASVRNFGLIWVSGRARGAELALALRSRERWSELADQAPDIGFRPTGSLTLATNPAELALMKEVVSQSDSGARGLTLIGADDVRSVNPAAQGEYLGGLWCKNDAVIEPGRVLSALRAVAARSAHYRWLPGHQVVGIVAGPGAGARVTDHLGNRHDGDLVVVCCGDRTSGFDGVVGATLASAPLRRCRLQMMQTAPTSTALTTAIADGDSMRYYPAFDLPGQGNLERPRTETVQWGMQLLMVQRATGGLTIGDTHSYDEPFDFALDESVFDHLRARAEALLGWKLPPIERRWAGVYSVATDDRVCFRQEVDSGVWVVTGPAGRGMTLSAAIAEETWNEVLK